MQQFDEAKLRDAPPREAGAEDEGSEVRRRKQAERERDAAAFRATEAARRAALARREAAEQRARAEAAEAREVELAAEAAAAAARLRAEFTRVAGERDALLRSTSWKITRPLRAAGERLPSGLKSALRGGAGFVHWTARLRIPAGRQKPSQ